MENKDLIFSTTKTTVINDNNIFNDQNKSLLNKYPPNFNANSNLERNIGFNQTNTDFNNPNDSKNYPHFNNLNNKFTHPDNGINANTNINYYYTSSNYNPNPNNNFANNMYPSSYSDNNFQNLNQNPYCQRENTNNYGNFNNNEQEYYPVTGLNSNNVEGPNNNPNLTLPENIKYCLISTSVCCFAIFLILLFIR